MSDMAESAAQKGIRRLAKENALLRKALQDIGRLANTVTESADERERQVREMFRITWECAKQLRGFTDPSVKEADREPVYGPRRSDRHDAPSPTSTASSMNSTAMPPTDPTRNRYWAKRFEAFGRACYDAITDSKEDGWGELDNDFMDEEAVALGLFERVIYDPAVHGDTEDFEPGDKVIIFVNRGNQRAVYERLLAELKAAEKGEAR